MTNQKTRKDFITAGKPVGIIGGGDDRCHREGDALVVPPDDHWGNPVFGDSCPAEGDYHVHAKLSIDCLAGNGASILLGGSYDEHWTRPEGSHALRICLDEDIDPAWKSMTKQMRIVHGPTHPLRSWFPADKVSDKQVVGVSSDFFRPGEPFTVDVVHRGSDLTLAINGREVFRTVHPGESGAPISVGFLPGRGTLRIQEFHAEGTFPGPISTPTDVWHLNSGGYSHYRTPSVCMTSSGRLLAFTEARRSYLSRGWEWEKIQGIEILSGEYHCAMKYSDDCGKTWSDQQIIVDQGSTYDARFPSPLPVQDSADLFLFLNGAWLLASQDNGQTWSPPHKLNGSLPGNWKSGNKKSPIPGTANSTIQLQHGPLKGRLIVAFHVGGSAFHAHGVICLMVSDDCGKTWQPGALTAVDMASNPTLVELADGRVLVSPQIHPRAACNLPGRPMLVSDDGGTTFTATHHDPALPLSCHGAMLAIDLPHANTAKTARAIVFCSSPTDGAGLTLTVSLDNTTTWPISHVIDNSSTSNPTLAALPNGHLGVLYERNHCRRVSFQKIDLNALIQDVK